MTTIIIFAVLAFIGLLLIGSNVLLLYKYLKLKKEIQSFKEIGTGRFGFYNYGTPSSSYRAIVYVDELDRYSDGYSKIKINRIEPTSLSYKKDSIEKAENSFITLKLTNEIEWLESEDHIRKLRKEKLENLKKI